MWTKILKTTSRDNEQLSMKSKDMAAQVVVSSVLSMKGRQPIRECKTFEANYWLGEWSVKIGDI